MAARVTTTAGLQRATVRSTKWTIVACDDGSVHVLPEADTKAHTMSEDCWCGPRIEFVAKEFLVTHMSHDRREFQESATRVPFERVKPVTMA